MFVSHLAFPAFGEHFWKPYARTATQGEPAAAQEAGATCGLYYSAQQHGAHADFCRGPHFQQYKEEVRAQLSFLVEFCRAQRMSDAAEIARNLQLFFNHRFDEHHYFSTRAEIVDSIGKQSLDEFCRMVRRDAIDVHTKQAAIRDFSMGVTQCADGAVSHLVGAARKLAKTAGGLRGALWAIKEEAARNALRETAQEHFSDEENYTGNEIHYVTTAWNVLADRYGFEKDPDGIKMREAQEYRFLLTCSARLKYVLTPDQLSLSMAQTLQARFNSRISTAFGQLGGAWTPEIQEQCAEQLQEIGDDFGLTSDDDFHFDPETRTWITREGELHLKSFLKLEDEGNTSTYTLRTDPALVALDLLRGMARLNLLLEADTPRMHGQWVEQDGMHAALFVYGDLAWVGRTLSPDALQLHFWTNKGMEIEPATVPALLRWQAGQPADRRSPLEAVISQAISATAAAQLADMPARWLRHNALIERFLRRLGKDEGMAYLSSNAADLGAELSDRRRHQLLDCIMRVGMGKAIPAVLARWFSNPDKHVNLVCRLLRQEAMPALRQAMREEDPKAAFHAWYEPLRESGLLVYAASRLTLLLEARDGEEYSLLGQVVCQGDTSAVEAFFLLLKDLMTHDAVQSYMKDTLPQLLSAVDSMDAPALSMAMAIGDAAVVQAFYAGLKDLLDPVLAGPIRAPLMDALPKLLVGKMDCQDSGLAYALGNGHTEVIEALHAVLLYFLRDPAIAPVIQLALPDMLTAEDGDGESGISFARKRGHGATLAAFDAMLADPAIRPYIGQYLAGYLAGGPAVA